MVYARGIYTLVLQVASHPENQPQVQSDKVELEPEG